jgi:Holliday junction resolvase RusA-like endonuclease
MIATEGNRERSSLGAWRTAIATEARLAFGDRPLLEGPLSIELAFRPASRPSSHYLPANRRRPVRELRANAPAWHAQKPDADKLERSALDALTGVIFRDDSQVAVLVASKRWPDELEGPGLTIRIRSLEETR